MMKRTPLLSHEPNIGFYRIVLQYRAYIWFKYSFAPTLGFNFTLEQPECCRHIMQVIKCGMIVLLVRLSKAFRRNKRSWINSRKINWAWKSEGSVLSSSNFCFFLKDREGKKREKWNAKRKGYKDSTGGLESNHTEFHRKMIFSFLFCEYLSFLHTKANSKQMIIQRRIIQEFPSILYTRKIPRDSIERKTR